MPPPPAGFGRLPRRRRPRRRGSEGRATSEEAENRSANLHSSPLYPCLQLAVARSRAGPSRSADGLNDRRLVRLDLQGLVEQGERRLPAGPGRSRNRPSALRVSGVRDVASNADTASQAPGQSWPGSGRGPAPAPRPRWPDTPCGRARGPLRRGPSCRCCGTPPPSARPCPRDRRGPPERAEEPVDGLPVVSALAVQHREVELRRRDTSGPQRERLLERRLRAAASPCVFSRRYTPRLFHPPSVTRADRLPTP